MKQDLTKLYDQNLRIIRRETLDLPDEVRSKLYNYGNNHYILTRIKKIPDLDCISAYFVDPQGRPMIVMAEAKLVDFKVSWKYSEMYKMTENKLCIDSKIIEYYENGIPQ